MKIIADRNMPLLSQTFGCHGDITLLNGREICRQDLDGAEVLLVRSVTRVDRELLAGTAIRFVGSATIGIDHLDTDWLEANDINWAHAPGCNADAAAQYTLAMMWLACDRLERDFRQQTVGIVGRGNVGRRLEYLLKVLNVPVTACDPPLQDQGELNLVSLDKVCDNSIVSLHTPLTHSGKCPTKNLFDSTLLATLAPGTLLVNASRGGVIEKNGLLEQLTCGRLNAALDVWPDEPFIDQQMLDTVTVATPHVAGYSREGKLAGTQMIYDAFCNALSITANGESASSKSTELEIPSTVFGDALLKQSILSSSRVVRDDMALRNLSSLTADNNRVHIDALRAKYPERYEFKSYSVNGVSHADAKLLKQLGFAAD